MIRIASAAALVAVLALVACNKPAGKQEAAASTASSTAPINAAPSSGPAAGDHQWTSKDGQEYVYVSNHGNAQAGIEPGAQTRVRYLGEQDGLYAIAEVADGQIVVASCSKPCQEVRVRGDNLDQTLPLSPDSTVAAALSDAMKGQLEKWTPPASAAVAATGPAKK